MSYKKIDPNEKDFKIGSYVIRASSDTQNNEKETLYSSLIFITDYDEYLIIRDKWLKEKKEEGYNNIIINALLLYI